MAEKKRPVGISFDPEMLDRLEDVRLALADSEQFDTIPSQSEAARLLLRYGLVVHETIEGADFDVEHGDSRERYARQALKDLIRRDV